ncbi:SRPBCC family protein [Lapillicoccus sp.]|uniref:SRPBCC family protein n=1 Tax=Lapillicoccus sp. TaxID=1909287 RepID=UPI002F92FC9A
MSRMEESIHVDVPVRVAYDQWRQFESFTSFMDGVESVTPDRPTHTHWVTAIGDVTRQFATEVGRAATRTWREDVSAG